MLYIFHNPDLLFRQPVKLADQGSLFVRRASLGELFMQSEHLLHQEGHAVVAGDVGGIGLSESAIAD